MLRAGDKLIIIGPTPPPIHGVTLMTPRVVDEVRRLGLLAGHLDTRDPRPVVTTNRLDLTNLRLAARHAAALARMLYRSPDAAVYLPVSQVRWGFLRDAVFIALAALFRRRVIIHFHGGAFQRFYRKSRLPMRLIIAATMRRVDEAWVLSEAHEHIFGGLIPSDRVGVLENGIPDFDRQIWRREEHDPRRPLRILYLSNLLPEKGCLDLLDALDAIGASAGAPPVEARFAGEADVEVEAEFRERAATLAMNGIMARYDGVLAGAEKESVFSWADVFVFPSRYLEGQGLCLLEAMAAGLPIIATTHPGIQATVREGHEGLLVAPGDPNALREAITRLAADAMLRARLGKAGRERFEERYTLEAFRRALARLLACRGALSDREQGDLSP